MNLQMNTMRTLLWRFAFFFFFNFLPRNFLFRDFCGNAYFGNYQFSVCFDLPRLWACFSTQSMTISSSNKRNNI